MKHNALKKIMIFGRPGSGKSTFAALLSRSTGLPLWHLDKYFFEANWKERDYEEFLQIQKNIIHTEAWIVDGNSTRSLEMRWANADCVLYFNFPKWFCIYRIFKRTFWSNQSLDDKAPDCKETVRLALLKYMWRFEKRVAQAIKIFKARYPHIVFEEIRNEHDLKQIKREWIR